MVCCLFFCLLGLFLYLLFPLFSLCHHLNHVRAQMYIVLGLLVSTRHHIISSRSTCS
ncbi:hypothetical protein BDV19DRAFT_374445 [Aspergillus venezuelensis]